MPPPPFEASLGAMGMALEGGEVNAGNEVCYLPVGLYSTKEDDVSSGGSIGGLIADDCEIASNLGGRNDKNAGGPSG
jgi:hypothetical protein